MEPNRDEVINHKYPRTKLNKQIGYALLDKIISQVSNLIYRQVLDKEFDKVRLNVYDVVKNQISVPIFPQIQRNQNESQIS